MKKLNLNLLRKDSDAFALLAYFKKEARKANWPKEKIQKVIRKTLDGNYQQLLQTLSKV